VAALLILYDSLEEGVKRGGIGVRGLMMGERSRKKRREEKRREERRRREKREEKRDPKLENYETKKTYLAF